MAAVERGFLIFGVFCYNTVVNKEKPMPYSEVFLGEMKKRLLEEKGNLEKELGVFAKEGKGGHYEAQKPERGDVYDENAQEVTELQNEFSVEPTLEKRLARVQKALKRMEDGSYGMCDGEMTPEARLEADPSAGALETRDEME